MSTSILSKRALSGRLVHAALAAVIALASLAGINGAADAAPPTVDYIVVFAQSNDVEGNGPGEVFTGIASGDAVVNGLTLHMSCSDLFNLYDKVGQDYIPRVRDNTNADWGFSASGGDPTAGTDERRIWDFRFHKSANDTVCGNANLTVPTIEVIKTADPTEVAEPGGVVTFSVSVENTSTVDTVTINSLSDVPYGDVTVVAGDIVSTTCAVPQVLAPGDTYQCSFDANVSGNAGDEKLDTVTASGVDDDNNPVSDSDDATVTILASSISIVKTGSLLLGDDGIANPGDIIEYTFEVTNDGEAPLDNVVVTDLTFGLTVTCGPWPAVQGELGVGESVTCTADYEITQDDIDAGSVDNCAQADGTTVPEGNAVSDEDCHEEPVPQVPSIDIAKNAEGPDIQDVILGGTATFTITVTNTGNVTLTDVTVTDPLVPNCEAGLGTLAPGETATPYECTIDGVNAPIFNIATAVGSPPGEGDDVFDADPSTVQVIAPSALVGDLVWNDEDKDQVQDAGELGIPNAQVKLTNLDTNMVQFANTNADGMYLFSALPQGNYRAELVLSSVDGDLTTVGFFEFFLADAASFLTADFGVVEELPVTGLDTDPVAWMGLALLALGGVMLLGAKRRREES